MRDSAALRSRLIALVAVLIGVGIVVFGRMSTKPSMQNLNGKRAQNLYKAMSCRSICSLYIKACFKDDLLSSSMSQEF